MTKSFIVIIIFVALVSSYFIFQCTSVVVYSNFSRSIVVSTHLLSVEFLVTNSMDPNNGDFALSLTFENPSTQTLNVTEIYIDYYIIQGPGSYIAARGNTTVPVELSPGETMVVLPMFGGVPQVSAPESFQCIVYYRLEFGSAHYRFEYFAYDSVAQTTGPYLLGGEDYVFPQVATYTLLVIDVWAAGLEIIGALILFQEGKSAGAKLAPEGKEHSKMAAIIYALQGTGLFIFFPSVSLLENSVAPPTQAYSSAGGWTSYIFVGLVELAGLILLLTALGLLQNRHAAMYVALSISLIIAFVSLYASFFILTYLATLQDLALLTLSIETLAANIIAFYILLKQRTRHV